MLAETSKSILFLQKKHELFFFNATKQDQASLEGVTTS